MTRTGRTRALLARRADLELTFVRHRRNGTVHILVPDDPDERGQEFRFADMPADRALDIALGARPTLCGYVAREHLGGAGAGDEPVDTFPDGRLCIRCHRALACWCAEGTPCHGDIWLARLAESPPPTD